MNTFSGIGIEAQTHYEVVETEAVFRELAPSWAALTAAAPRTVFQSHHWLAAWYRHHSQEFRLRIGVASNGSRLVSILPFAVHRYRGTRILEWAAQTHSDYCDGLGDPKYFAALWQKVVSAGRVDMVRLKNVGSDAIARALLDSLGARVGKEDFCLGIRREWADGEAWFRTLNKKKRNNYSRARRKLAEFGDITVEYHSSIPDSHVIPMLFNFKIAWAREQGRSSKLIDTGLVHFTDFIKSLEAANNLCLVLIRCNGDIVAGSVNIKDGTRMLAWFAAYDAAYEAASPGITIMIEYTRWGFDKGYTDIDYLRGAEAYKFEFANSRADLSSYVLPLTVTGRLALTLSRVTNRGPKTLTGTPFGAAYMTQAGNSRMQTVGVRD